MNLLHHLHSQQATEKKLFQLEEVQGQFGWTAAYTLLPDQTKTIIVILIVPTAFLSPGFGYTVSGKDKEK